MQPTTEKITVSQSDYNNLADFAKPSYQVQTQTAPTLNQTNNQIQQTQPQASLAITPQSLQQTPQIKIPSIKNTDTTSAGIVASTQPSVQTAQENYNQVQQATGTQAQDAQTALQKMAENIFGKKADAQSNQVNLENLAGIQEQQKALGEINTNIASEQVALRGEQEKVRQGYATEQQKQISNNTLNDTYGRRLADLAIRQSAANQNITSIRENADRQTKLLTAPLDTKIQYLSSFGKDNVDFLSKEQQNKLAFISDDLKSQKQDIQALQQAKTNMITEIANNGGGTNQELIRRIQSATDIGSVTSIGASSGLIGALDRQVKLANIAQSRASTAKIYQDIAESNMKNQLGAGNLRQLSYEDNARLNSTPQAKVINDGVRYAAALDNYKDAIQKYGTGEVLGRGKGALGEAYQALVGVVKDYYTLGTYDNGVEKLIGMGISKPGVIQLSSKQFGALDSAKNEVASTLDRNINQLSSTAYNNSIEGQTLIQTGKAVSDTVQLAKKNNEEFLNSLESVSGTTSAVNNQSFFNK